MATGYYSKLAQLRALLQGMEEDLGIEKMHQNEKDVLYATALIVVDDTCVIRSGDMREQRLLLSMATATFHRALRSLVKKGILRHAKGTRAGSYILVNPAGDRSA